MELAIFLPLAVVFRLRRRGRRRRGVAADRPAIDAAPAVARVPRRAGRDRDAHRSLGDGLASAVQRVRSFVPKSPKDMNRIQRMMASAGYHGPWPATIFALAQIVIRWRCSVCRHHFGVRHRHGADLRGHCRDDRLFRPDTLAWPRHRTSANGKFRTGCRTRST